MVSSAERKEVSRNAGQWCALPGTWARRSSSALMLIAARAHRWPCDLPVDLWLRQVGWELPPCPRVAERCLRSGQTRRQFYLRGGGMCLWSTISNRHTCGQQVHRPEGPRPSVLKPKVFVGELTLE